jgi:hypothetical protein
MIYGRLVIIGIGSEEVLPERYEIEDTSSFAVQCFMRVGTSAGPGTQDQTILVCSPAWLLVNQPPQSVVRGQGLLLMQRYNGLELHRTLKRFIERCAAATTAEVFSKMGRLGFSEFEDYNDVPMPHYFIDERHENEPFGAGTRV